jgi:putative transposase
VPEDLSAYDTRGESIILIGHLILCRFQWTACFKEEQIIGILKEADAGVPIADLCRKHGMSTTSFYAWRKRYGGKEVSEATRKKSPPGETTTTASDFPEAQIVADKFHVLALPMGALMKYRKDAEGGRNTAYLRKILLQPGYQVLDYWKPRLHKWLRKHPQLHEVYVAKGTPQPFLSRPLGRSGSQVPQEADR